jgi:hypothetical protein
MAKPGSPSHSKEFNTLLEELRVLLPGVEVIFAFLLTVPFTERFTELSGTQRNAYFVAFLAATLASILLTAPSVYHRLRWREVDKESALRTGNVFAICGITVLAVAIGAAVFLVADVLFASRAAALLTGAVSVVILGLWYLLPLTLRLCGSGTRGPSTLITERD